MTVKPDVVFSFSTTLGHFSLFLNLLGSFKYFLINGSIRDAPVMLNLQHRFEKFLYNFYADVVSNSHSGLKAFNQIDKQGRYILYNAFDMKRIPVGTKLDLRQKLGIDDKFIVVMVASMNSSKDQDSFICAAHRIIKKNYDIDILFYLIGNGPKKVYYEEKIKYLGINESVLFTGTIDNVEEYLKAANLSVLTSASYHGEGIPNVVLESLACGTPVIATDNGGTKEILLHNYNGYLIKNGDYKDLANKLIFLYNNPDVLKSFSGKGVETVKNHFSIEKMIVEFESIIAS
jgi:glycosyltransferase involved in cell wall biosynthesis